MKFGKQIQSQQIPGWSSYYLDYKALKKIVSSLTKKGTGIDSSPEHRVAPDLDRSQVAANPRTLWISNNNSLPGQPAPPLLSTTGNDDERGPMFQKHKAAFFFKLERELEKINTFYLQKEAELKLRLDTLLSKRKAASLHVISEGTPESTTRDHVEWKAVEEGFRLLQRDLGKLQQFIEMNATGFRKILKKWDKRSKSTTKELYLARQVEVQPVFDRKLIAELSDIVATCLLDLTNIAIGPSKGVLGAGDILLGEQLALETSGQVPAFHDLELNLREAVVSGNENALKECISRASNLTKGYNCNTQIARILWKAAIEAAPPLADIIMFSPPFDFRFIDDINYRTCLHEAAIAGETRLIDLCLQRHVQVDRQDVYGRTALHYAAMHGHSAACSCLLQSGMSASTVDLDNYTPLIYATVNGHANCVEVLLSRSDGLQGTTTDLEPVALACQRGHQEIVTMLLGAGAKCEPNTNGEFPIHLAAREGHGDICKVLLGYPGFDLPDKFNEWAPLFHAARYGHQACVKILLDGGANPFKLDDSGRQSSFYAAWYGHLDILDLLQRTVSPSLHPNDIGISPPANMSSISPLSDMGESQEEEFDLIPSLSLPPPIMPFRVYGHNYLRDAYLVQISLGHPTSATRNHGAQVAPVRLLPYLTGGFKHTYPDIAPSMKLVVTCKSDVMSAPFAVTLPLQGEEEDIAFQFADPEELFLEFSLYLSFGSKVIGKSILLPSAFKDIKTRGRYVAPVLDHHLQVIGEVGFEVCIISPFRNITLDVGGAMETYWKSAATPFGIAGTRAPRERTHSGTGSTHASPGITRPLPSLSDNTVTSSSLTGEYAHIIVQVTRDLIPVLYPTWYLPVADFNLGVADVTVEQFSRLSKEQSHEVDQCQQTKEHFDLHASDSFLTLAEVFKRLPPELGISIEIACPTTGLKDELFLGHSHKLNQLVDSVLEAVYASVNLTSTDGVAGPRRKIVFSSYHPDICVALNWKQPNYPVIFTSFCGTRSHWSVPGTTVFYPDTDSRCCSISNALNFAKANNLLGLAVPAELLLRVPPLVRGLKDAGITLSAFGASETIKRLDEVLRNAPIGLDGSFCDNIVTFFESSTRMTTFLE